MLAAEQGEESVKMMPTTTIKPLHKIISEHKDIVKIVIQLNSIISTFKMDVQEVLEHFTKYTHLWSKVSVGCIHIKYMKTMRNSSLE